MRIRLIIAGIAIAAATAACMPVRGTNEGYMSDAELEAKDNSVCQSFGAKPGTQPYVDCRLRLRADRSQEDRARRLNMTLFMM